MQDIADAGFTTPKSQVRCVRAAQAAQAHSIAGQDIDDNAPCSRTPWNLGSISRPCSTPHLAQTVADLVPAGKLWLRKAFAVAALIKDPCSSACSVIPDTEPFDLRAAAKVRLASRTCLERTPGLCCCTENFRQIQSMRSALTKTVDKFVTGPACHGELLLGFALKPSDQAMQSDGPAQLLACRHVAFMFLSCEPDKRKGWKVFTSCSPQAAPVSYPFGLSLDNAHGEFVEHTDYVLAAKLYAVDPTISLWNVHRLEYRDIADRMCRVVVVGASNGTELGASRSEARSAAGPKEMDDFEAMWERTCTLPKGKPAELDDGSETDSSIEATRELEPGSADEAEITDAEVAEELAEHKKQRIQRRIQRRTVARTAASSSDAGVVSVDSPRFSRAGHFVLWHGKRIGKLTQWGGSLSCHCHLHKQCKTPAMALAKVGSDARLLSWLLASVNYHGSTSLSQAQHKEQARQLKEELSRTRLHCCEPR